jgi:predicted SAM-dependent methyltransferase
MKLVLEKISNRIKAYTVGLQLNKFRKNSHYFVDKIGLEIGGPSQIFRSDQILPVYRLAKRIDGVNFSNQTVWENNIQAGETYKYETNKVGYQYILEASNLSSIPDNQYDFILSSHSLEHCANPLKALIEWQRVLRKGGVILVAVPDKRVTFDWRRNTTDFEHIIMDYEAKVEENDQTHVEEIMRLHDLSKDPGVKSYEYFLERSLKNYENRCLHHHVFSIELLKQMFIYIKMKPVFTDFFLPSLIILSEK